MRPVLFLVLLSLSACASNHAPTIEAPSSLDVREGEEVAITVVVADADGDPVALEVSASDDLRVREDPEAPQRYLVAAGAAEGARTVTLSASDGQALTTVTVAVAVTQMAWGPTRALAPAGLPAREHAVFFMDPARDRAIVIGGSGYSPQYVPIGDAWQIALADGTASPLERTGDVPPATASQRVALVPGTTQAYLHGGYSMGENGFPTSSADIFRVDYGGDSLVYEKLAQVNPPPARDLHGFVYEPLLGQFFVFGGTAPFPVDDIWIGQLEGSTVSWRQSPAYLPTPRYGFFYGQYDGKLYVYSGAQGIEDLDPARDLAIFDLLTDSTPLVGLLSGEGVPPGRRNGCFAMDEVRGRLYVFGGTADGRRSEPGLHVLDARDGQHRFATVTRPGEPPLRSSGSAAIDPRDGSVYFGFGNDDDAYSDLTRLGYP